MPAAINRPMRPNEWALLLVLSLLWGGSFCLVGIALREPGGERLLILLVEPAIVEHELGGPFIAHVLDEAGEELVGRIGRDDGAVGVALFQFEDHRR